MLLKHSPTRKVCIHTKMLGREIVEKIVNIQKLLEDNLNKCLFAVYEEKIVPPYGQKEFSFNSIIIDEYGVWLVNVFEYGTSRYGDMLNINKVESIHVRDVNKTMLLEIKPHKE